MYLDFVNRAQHATCPQAAVSKYYPDFVNFTAFATNIQGFIPITCAAQCLSCPEEKEIILDELPPPTGKVGIDYTSLNLQLKEDIVSRDNPEIVKILEHKTQYSAG